MPNNDLNTNEVIVNGQVIMSTRNDTVTPQTLVKDETATNKEGAKIVGELDPVSHNEAYLIDDPEGDIDDSDYIPFNDVSDEEQPKKKTLFSSIVDKLKTIFVSKSWEHVELLPTTETLGIKDKEVDATASNNGVTANHYPSSNDIRDNNNKIIARSEAIVYPNGTITAKMYAQNYDTNGNSVGQNAINLNVDKLGAFSYNVSDPNAFRSAIKTVDQLGTDIPENADLNTYKTAGTYRVPSDGIGATISNLPLALCGKVVVFNNGNGGFEQFYFPNHSPRIFVRTWWSDAWSAWKEIGEGGGDSKIHTYEDGIAIPADSDLNDYKTAGVYTTTSDSIASTIINIPKPTTGKLIVSYSAPSHNYVQQIYIVAHNNDIYTRFYDNWNLVWKDWKKIATNLIDHVHLLDGDIFVNDISHKILYTDDLNDFINSGTYQYTYNENGMPSNCPLSGIRSFKLVVDRYGSDSRSEIEQRITMINGASTILDWYRVREWNSTTWGAWKQLASTDDLIPHTYEMGTNIPANSDFDNYKTEGVYYVSNATDASTISNIPVSSAGKLIVMDRDTGARLFQIYMISRDEIYMRDMSNDSVFSDWRNITRKHTYEVGTSIPASSDLNTYIVDGVYKISPDATAQTIVNIPSHGNTITGGKLVVSKGYSANENYIIQTYYSNDNYIFVRRSADSGTTWFAWKQLASTDDVSPSTVGNGYAVATVSGSAITATISGFQLRAGVIVALKISHFIGTACTLNINNTGAKQVLALNNSQISEGYPIVGGYVLYTFMYDGTNYRILSWDATPSIAQQDYVADTSGNIIVNWGYDVNRAQIKYGLSTNKLSWNYYKNSAWRGDVKIADYDDLGASVAKTGKSILPSWGYNSNIYSANGLTFTFNPSTGEITVNGTATADTFCKLAGESYSQYSIPKGTYIFTGCPSGGSDTKYKLYLQVVKKGASSLTNYNDFGNGCDVNLDVDSYSGLTSMWGIIVRSGQTLSNLVFKPMLRPAFTTAEYEPCEDIHKGNCYVGTCTTAGGTKDKVAYVDGYFVLRKGVRVAIKFSNTNTYSNVTTSPITLNVNDTGAKNIWYNSTHSGAGNTGTGSYIYGEAGKYFYFVYDGTYWIWDGRTTDSNSTNFLRNDASSTMTTSTPVLTLKASNIDLTQANNGVTSTQYPAYTIVDKNGKTMARFEAITETNGNISSFLYAGNIKTSDGTHFNGGIKLIAKKDGSFTWNITGDKASFHNNIGIGYCTCSTAESTSAKTATLKDYALCNGSIVVVHFSYNVPANSTLNINGQGAKAIYYRTVAIKNNVIKGGDKVTLIYDGTNYHVINIDRTAIGRHDCITMSNLKWGTVASTLVKTDNNYTVRGDIIGGVLYFNMEINFKTNGTLPSYSNTAGGIFMIPNMTSFTWRMAHAEYAGNYLPCYTSTQAYDGSTGIMLMLRKSLAVATGTSLKISFEVPLSTGFTN